MKQVIVFFFFKQKTAYEMRISDWSSDVCSSDLKPLRPPIERTDPRHVAASIAGDLDPQGHQPLARVVARDRAGLPSVDRGSRHVDLAGHARAGPPPPPQVDQDAEPIDAQPPAHAHPAAPPSTGRPPCGEQGER